MTHPRRFRFGVEMQRPFEGMSWVESAREVESMGYATLFVPDHFHQGLGPIAAMTAAAGATSVLKVAPLVLAADFRHPAVVARELASIDVLSSGRLEVGVGAGYNPLDYQRSGIPMAPAGERVDRLIEHVGVLRALFRGGAVTFAGEHYRIDALELVPAPFTPGGPPILVAGGGRRLLSFAAAAADIVGVNPAIRSQASAGDVARDALPDRIDEKFRWIAAAAPQRVAELEFNAWVSVAVVNETGRTHTVDLLDSLERRFRAPADQVLQSPVVLVGSVAEIVDRLHQRRERWGYSYITVQGPAAHSFAHVVQQLTGN